MNSEKRLRTEKYLLTKIAQKDPDYVKKTADTFGIARSTVYNYISVMTERGIVRKNAAGGFPLSVCTEKYTFTYKNDGSLLEDKIFERDIEPLLKAAEDNARSIWRYAFCEMMNNAIEHSGAREITCTVAANPVFAEISVADNGIGIFENIRRYLKKTKGEDYTLAECTAFLLPGKFTTNSEAHSGEGIFFTSQITDEFYILSSGVTFSRKNLKNVFSGINNGCFSTSVQMKLYNDTAKRLRDVFDRYSDTESGFFRTSVPMLTFFPSGFPVARSEARRLFAMLSGFSEAVLDFSGISSVGQAFVHELFSVLSKSGSVIRLECENMSPDVEFMIKRNK